MLSNPPTAKPWRGTSYRNIYTCFPSQDLCDDLDLTPDEKTRVEFWENKSSDIDHAEPQTSRVFQYGDNGRASSMAVFDSLPNWPPGRFNTNAFGVWYGALEEETSILETLYWFYQRERHNLAFAKKDIRVDRKMFRAKLACKKMVDLTLLPDEEKAQVLHPTDYTFSKKVGAFFKNRGDDGLLVPSVRKKGGTCTPIFSPGVIIEDQGIYFLRYTLTQTGKLSYERINSEPAVTVDAADVWR